ncbi:MAG: regulatory protein RecX [Idiomarina sp.]|nr:regulatory protein RecX [Idiomarina sp.]
MNNKNLEDAVDESLIEARAVHLLSRREHSRTELFRKLTQKGFDAEATNRVLDALQAREWQSEQRFCESFVRQRVLQSQGPLKIRSELNQRGVQNELIERVLAEAEIDWFALAVECLQRRFKRPAGSDRKEYARRQRFLASRGFLGDHIRAAMSQCENDVPDPWDAVL